MTPRETLGVALDATWEQIRKAYAALTQQYYPEERQDNAGKKYQHGDTAKFHEVRAAYDALKAEFDPSGEPADESATQDPSAEEEGIPRFAAKALAELRKTLYTRDGNLVDIRDGTIRDLTKPNDIKFYLWRILPKLQPEVSDKQYYAIAADILSNPAKTAGFRPIERITHQPTFRPDFSLVPKGYDPSTRLYYEPDDEVRTHRFNLRATQQDAINALEKLDYLFADFPFADQSSRTNTIAALITLIIRPAIKSVVPAWTCNGGNEFSQNVGKGKIVKALVSISFGCDAKISTVPPTATQMLQTLSAEVRNGAPYVVFDDVKTGQRLESNDLNAFLTADVWNCKIPGTIISVEVPVRLVMLITGNNLKVSVDLTNRMCWSELIHENTQKRSVNDFRIYRDHQMEFDDYLNRNRLNLLDAAVTMVLAWKNGGLPKRKPSSPLVKYGQWERLVGGILEYAGAADFLANQQARCDAADDRTAEIIMFIEKLIETFPTIESKPVLLRDIATAMMLGGPLVDILPSMPRTEHRLVISLGKLTKSVAGRVFTDHKLVSKAGTGNKSEVWCPKVGLSGSGRLLA